MLGLALRPLTLEAPLGLPQRERVLEVERRESLGSPVLSGLGTLLELHASAVQQRNRRLSTVCVCAYPHARVRTHTAQPQGTENWKMYHLQVQLLVGFGIGFDSQMRLRRGGG